MRSEAGRVMKGLTLCRASMPSSAHPFPQVLGLGNLESREPMSVA